MRTRDYQVIADIIGKLPKNFGLRETVAKHFANEFAKINSRFKKDKFIDACCVTDGEENDE